MIEIVVGLVFTGIFLLAGIFIGGARKRAHLKSLQEREAANSDFILTTFRRFPWGEVGEKPPTLVGAEASISSDYLKNFLSGWRKFFGGEMKSYQDLEERARREAIQRLIAAAKAEGYNAICNLRLDSIDIAGAAKNPQALAMSSFYATGTAYYATKKSA